MLFFPADMELYRSYDMYTVPYMCAWATLVCGALVCAFHIYAVRQDKGVAVVVMTLAMLPGILPVTETMVMVLLMLIEAAAAAMFCKLWSPSAPPIFRSCKATAV